MRRAQEDRSRETRRRLLDAAIAVLIERGYDGLSMAEVSARAGVSNGARVHHFRAKADLVIAAAQRTYQHSAQLSRMRAHAARGTGDPISVMVEFCLDHYFDWPFRAATEIVNAARTKPELMAEIKPILANFHEELKTTWCDVMVDVGYDPIIADRQFRMTLNHIRGLALTSLWHERTDEELRRIIAEWVAYLEPRDA